MMKRLHTICFLLLFAASMPVVGASATYRGPEPGRPAVVVPGGVMGVGERDGETVTLVRGTERHSLSVVAPTGVVPVGTGYVHIPKAFPVGRYELVGPREDNVPSPTGVVHVLPEFPEAYAVAVVRGDRSENTTGTVFSDALVAAVADSPAALVFLVGALTGDGTAASYTALDAQWSALSVPVFYCPDADETTRRRAAGLALPGDHAIAFGRDGYLLLGAGLPHSDVGVDGRMGAIQRWRRALRASRWSVGVAGRFGLDWSIRAQLVLFVDDPLDYLVTAETLAGVGETLPWGRTRYAIPPTAPSVPLQLIAVDGGAMRAVMVPEVSEVPEVSATE